MLHRQDGDHPGERYRALNRDRRSAEEIAQVLVKEFNWGTGPAAGNIAGMMQELR